jgi:hypothetical protein
MISQSIRHWLRFAAVTAASAGLTVALLTVTGANAADLAAGSLKFADGVVKHEAYETPETSYIVANPTNVFHDKSWFGTKVTGELKRGERVEILAKVKGYDWVLVGKDGTGIGYVAISMLSPADKYIP